MKEASLSFLVAVIILVVGESSFGSATESRICYRCGIQALLVAQKRVDDHNKWESSHNGKAKFAEVDLSRAVSVVSKLSPSKGTSGRLTYSFPLSRYELSESGTKINKSKEEIHVTIEAKEVWQSEPIEQDISDSLNCVLFAFKQTQTWVEAENVEFKPNEIHYDLNRPILMRDEGSDKVYSFPFLFKERRLFPSKRSVHTTTHAYINVLRGSESWEGTTIEGLGCLDRVHTLGPIEGPMIVRKPIRQESNR